MANRHLEFSVVVVANDHNPTILNPDFLERQQIVPQTWGWKVADPAITTPPFAMVVYDSGVTVSVEPNKLQIPTSLSGVALSPARSLTLPESTWRFCPTFVTRLWASTSVAWLKTPNQTDF